MSSTRISADLRDLVIERAGHCCEYCLIHQADNFLRFEIDHIIAEKHHGTTSADNLCWSCSTCNGYKGSDVASYDPVTMQLTPLYNPRIESWHAHFMLQVAEIVPRTAVGRVTVAILKLNDLERVKDRTGLIQLGRYPCTVAEAF